MTTASALQRLAAATHATYQAGFAAGRCAWPHIHAIDWREVWAVLRAGLAVLIAAIAAAVLVAGPALCAISEALGRRYAALLVGTTARPVQAAPVTAPAAPVAATTTAAAEQVQQAPAAAPAPALEALAVRELRQLARTAGHRALARSGRRADLLAVLA